MSTRVITVTLEGRTTTVQTSDPARILNVGPPGADGAGAVASVNGHAGVVVLTASDVSADASGAASTAQAAAIAAAASDATTKANAAQSTAISTAASDATTKANAAQAAAIAASQPADSDLTAIAALTTTTYGRALLALADASAGRTALGLGTAATHATTEYEAAGAAAAAQAASQPLDSDLTAIAALTTTSTGRSLLAAADAAALRTILALGTAATTTTGTGSTNTILGNDSRLSDSRTPTAHKTSHATGGSDALTPADIGGTPSTRLVSAGTGLTGGGDLSADRTLAVSFGTTSGTSAQGNDARLADTRTPTDGTVTLAKLATSALAVTRPYSAPSGNWQHPSHFLSSAAGALTSGTVFLVPFDVGPTAKSYAQLGVYCSTQVTGGTITVTLGLYSDDASGGQPDFTSLLDSGTVSFASQGRKTISLNGGSNRTLQPGRYWGAFLYVVSVAPTTPPQCNNVANAAGGLWIADATNIGTSSRALTVTSSTLPTTNPQTVGSHSSTSAPVLALKAT